MNVRLRVAFYTLAFGAAATTAAQAALPVRPAPAGLRSIDDASGGRIIVGGLGPVAGPGDAFRAGLHRVRGYFSSMQLENVVRSKDGTLTMGLFRARLGADDVSGLALSAYRPGASQVAILFDDRRRLRQSMPKLVAHLQSISPAATASRPRARSGANEPSLEARMRAVRTVAMTSNDGTVSAQLPEGWQMKQFGGGMFVADGAGGAEVVQGVSLQVLDPRGQLYQQAMQMGRPPAGYRLFIPYTTDPARAYERAMESLNRSSGSSVTFTSVSERPIRWLGPNGAEVSGTSVRNGKTLRFDEYVGVSPEGPYGGWQIAVNGAVAPEVDFERDEPEMAVLFRSWRPNEALVHAQVESNIASGWAQSRAGRANLAATTARDQGVVDASMRNARAAQDGIDRSTAGFVRYLNGTDVVEHGPSGAHLDVDSGTSAALQSFDPQHFTSVPVSQYVKGVDY